MPLSLKLPVHAPSSSAESHLSKFQIPVLQIYILADTSYNSLGVDEVAAAHVNADSMVGLLLFHFEVTARKYIIFAFTVQK